MIIPPPDPKEISPSDLWRAFLAPRPRREFHVELSGVGRVRLFARAIGSAEWMSRHSALARALETDAGRAEANFLAGLVLDEGGRALDADDVLALYEHEQASVFAGTIRALRIISPTYAAADIKAWLDRLKEGARSLENLCDALSFGGCCNVSWGFGRGAVHVRDEPEAFLGIPRRDLLDCHWLAYHAARAVANEINRKN